MYSYPSGAPPPLLSLVIYWIEINVLGWSLEYQVRHQIYVMSISFQQQEHDELLLSRDHHLLTNENKSWDYFCIPSRNSKPCYQYSTTSDYPSSYTWMHRVELCNFFLTFFTSAVLYWEYTVLSDMQLSDKKITLSLFHVARTYYITVWIKSWL